MFLAIVLAIAVASFVLGKNLRRSLAILVAVLCVEAGFSFVAEFRCNPDTICTALSGAVLAINVGVLVFLLKPVRGISSEI
jgi:NADH:ubiquinone oxidoreductase subunit 6 (subunit J)